jgi:hypothetical protein
LHILGDRPGRDSIEYAVCLENEAELFRAEGYLDQAEGAAREAPNILI